MTKQSLTPAHWILSLLAIGGLALLIVSLLSPTAATSLSGPLRVSGLALLSLGIGEFLNRPLHRAADAFETIAGMQTSGPARRPCALGNLLIIFSIICAFAAASLYFFPHGA